MSLTDATGKPMRALLLLIALCCTAHAVVHVPHYSPRPSFRPYTPPKPSYRPPRQPVYETRKVYHPPFILFFPIFTTTHKVEVPGYTTEERVLVEQEEGMSRTAAVVLICAALLVLLFIALLIARI